MTYNFFLPCRALSPYIQFFGLLEQYDDFTGQKTDLIPPYPCKGLIFSLVERPPVLIQNSDFRIQAVEGYIMPQCTESWHMKITGNFRFLGVFFRPGMFRHFFPIPAAEITNQMLSFEEAGLKDMVRLQARMLEIDSLRERLNLIERSLLFRLKGLRFKPTLSDNALKIVQQNAGIKIDHLTATLGFSSRYFRKTFARDIGVSPKTFLKIVRFNKAFEMLKSGRFAKLSDIAYRLQYFDQSHFIREFRHFTGTTPFQFSKEQHALHNKIYWRDDGLITL